MSVRKAVIPAAGLGTRFLPATKAIPKEMIPVIDRPGIQYAVEEGRRAGLTDVVLITSRGKTSLEDHFDRALELEHHLEQAGKEEELDMVRRVAELAQVFSVRQKEPRGFGDAVALAKGHVGNEPFAVLVPDEIVPEPMGDERALLERMIEIHEQHGCSVVAVQEVPLDEISSYGSVAVEELRGDHGRIVDIVEKPAPEEAPSNLASRGRYIFTPDIFDALERTEPGVGGEIQLTDAIRLLVKEQGVYVFVYRGPIYDVGKKLDYLRATVELTLRREDLGKPFAEWLRELVDRLDGSV